MFFTGIKQIYASSCSYAKQAELNSEVANIKVSYEEKTGYRDSSEFYCQDDDPECVSEYNYFEISILNMTDDFYIVVKNDQDNVEKTYTINDAVDGIIRFDFEGIMNITTFKFDIYSSTNTPCPRENYRTIYLTTPRKNPYYYYLQCQNNPDYYLCKKYVTFEDVGFYEFIEKVDKYVEEHNEELKDKQQLTTTDKIMEYIKEHKILVISSLIGIVGIAVITTWVVINKRRKRII